MPSSIFNLFTNQYINHLVIYLFILVINIITSISSLLINSSLCKRSLMLFVNNLFFNDTSKHHDSGYSYKYFHPLLFTYVFTFSHLPFVSSFSFNMFFFLFFKIRINVSCYLSRSNFKHLCSSISRKDYAV